MRFGAPTLIGFWLVSSCSSFAFAAKLDQRFLASDWQHSPVLRPDGGQTDRVPWTERGNQYKLMQEAPYKYIGNCFSNKFHRPWCPFEHLISARHARLFCLRRDAVLAGFDPCRYCLPPIVKQLRGTILNDQPSCKTTDKYQQSTVTKDPVRCRL